MKTLLLLVLCIGLGAHSFSQSDCIDPTSLSYNPDALFDCSGVESGNDFSCCSYYYPCLHTCFTSYDSNIRTRDCLGIIGGFDTSCCIFESAHSRCCSPREVVAGEEESWHNVLTNTSEYSCSSTLVYDLWYEYIPTVSGWHRISVDAEFPTAFSLWQGVCLEDDFHSISCFPNDELLPVTNGEVLLTAGDVYLIQLGANSDAPVSPHGEGTLNVDVIPEEELGCLDPLACNYNEFAVYEVYSCSYIGDVCSDNADFTYSYFDESCFCIEIIVGDFSGDGFVNVADLGGFLGAFGASVNLMNIAGDFTGDGFINISDLGGFLGAFGQSFPLPE